MENENKQLTQEEISVITGLCLGHGELSEIVGGTHSNLSIHKTRQFHGYLRWLNKRLESWAKSKIIFNTNKEMVLRPSGKVKAQIEHEVFFETINHPVFTNFRLLFYPKDKKIIPIKTEILLDPLSLAVWYMECGQLRNERTTFQFVTQYDEESVLRLKRALDNNFEAETSLEKSEDAFVISTSVHQLLPIIGPIVWKVAPMRHLMPKGYFPIKNSSQNQTPNIPQE